MARRCCSERENRQAPTNHWSTVCDHGRRCERGALSNQILPCLVRDAELCAGGRTVQRLAAFAHPRGPEARTGTRGVAYPPRAPPQPCDRARRTRAADARGGLVGFRADRRRRQAALEPE